MKKIIILILNFLILGFFMLAGSNSAKVRVIVETASVRLRPDISSQILAQVPQGTILELVSKKDGWYLVSRPPDERGSIISGYLHESLIEVVEEKAEPQRALVKPPREEAPPIRPRPEERSQEEYEKTRISERFAPRQNLFRGLYLRFGLLTSPDAGSFSNQWIADFGFDIGLGRYMGLGVEIQPTYRNYSEIDLTVIPIMGFVNLKAGLNLLSFINLYAGGGPGLEFSHSSLTIEGQKLSLTETKFAYHLLLGTELNLKAIRLTVEYQMARVPDPSIDPNFWSHFILFGFRF